MKAVERRSPAPWLMSNVIRIQLAACAILLAILGGGPAIADVAQTCKHQIQVSGNLLPTEPQAKSTAQAIWVKAATSQHGQTWADFSKATAVHFDCKLSLGGWRCDLRATPCTQVSVSSSPVLAQRPGKPTAEQDAKSEALQAPLKLDAVLSKGVSQLVLPPDWGAEDEAHKLLRSRYSEWKFQYYDLYRNKVNNCVNKNHTVADQQAAGCLPNDTLALCMDKIYNNCLDHPPGGPSRKLVESGMNVLVDLAKALSAEAANLATRIPNALPKFREVPLIIKPDALPKK